ncbi:hypothetical protein FGB62_201g015 [Gracilaria domingensis]|nr:hypothetical protein FGB62_201g015 [Gracilaria domingensis]
MTSTYRSDESREGNRDPQVANWPNKWSKVMMFREMQRSYAVDLGLLNLRLHEYKIKRLIENLPPGQFQIRRQDVEVIERICSSGLENFLLFLQCEPVDVASNAREAELKNSSIVSAGALCAERNGVRVEASSDVETTSECRANVADVWKCSRRRRHHDEGTLWNGVAIRTGTELEIGRVLDLKPGFRHLPEIDAEELQRDEESCIRGNLFAVGNEHNAARHHDLESREENKCVLWDTYLKELCIHSPVSSMLNSEGVSLCCISQSYYWNTWNLPEMAPPALGDIGLEDYESDTKRIRFIGYVLEKVRNCVTKWTGRIDESESNESS